MNISDIITDRLPNTESTLAAVSDLDWASAKSRAITLAKYEVYGSDKAESDIGDARIKEFIALKACLPLIEMAVDYLMDATRLGDTKQDATFSYHDRVAILERKRKRIEREIAVKRADVLDLVDNQDLEDDSMDVSTLHPDHIAASRMLTPSPWAIQDK